MTVLGNLRERAAVHSLGALLAGLTIYPDEDRFGKIALLGVSQTGGAQGKTLVNDGQSEEDTHHIPPAVDFNFKDSQYRANE